MLLLLSVVQFLIWDDDDKQLPRDQKKVDIIHPVIRDRVIRGCTHISKGRERLYTASLYADLEFLLEHGSPVWSGPRLQSIQRNFPSLVFPLLLLLPSPKTHFLSPLESSVKVGRSIIRFEAGSPLLSLFCPVLKRRKKK